MAEFQGVTYRKRGPPATDAEIASFQRQIEHRLPDDYRAFLQAVNGGDLRDDMGVAVEDQRLEEDLGEENVPVDALYSIIPGDRWYIPLHSQDYNYHLRTPADIFPIGQNGYEHRLSMSLGGDDYGQVYVCIPSPGELWIDDDECQQDYSELYKLADDFTEFWKALRPIPPMY